jgi:molybdate transport system ATP-binding protein
MTLGLSVTNHTPGLTVAIEQQQPMPLAAAFHCAPGELLALVGPSGAGKTSLLRVIAGLMRPERGQVQVGTTCWCDTAADIFVPPQQRHLGLVFQSYALMPHLSALDNVALSLLHLPPSERRREAARWLEHVHVETVLHAQRPERLSGGQQQRVAVARALARAPQLLLLDEPFSAVDHLTRRSLYRLLAELRHELAIPIILVTHNLHEARMLADRMAVMDRGQVMQVGTPDEIYKAPRNARVADLVGLDNRFQGVWLGPTDEPGWGWLRWTANVAQGQVDAPVLRVRDKGKIPTGQAIHWLIPGEGLCLVDGSPREANEFAATLLDVRHLGALTLCTLALAARPGAEIELTLTGPERRRRNPGEHLTVRLDLTLVHVMPFRD